MSVSSENNSSRGCLGSLFGTFSTALICATIAFIAYLFFSSHAEPTRRLWLPVVVDTNGPQAIMADTRQMEFWTPSAKTKDFLGKNGSDISEKDKWQIVPTDDVVTEFGSVLHSNKSVFGYRRVEVWGQGLTVFKPGWWWTLTVATDYTVVDLARAYQVYWKSPKPVFVEVIDNRGITDK